MIHFDSVDEGGSSSLEVIVDSKNIFSVRRRPKTEVTIRAPGVIVSRDPFVIFSVKYVEDRIDGRS